MKANKNDYSVYLNSLQTSITRLDFDILIATVLLHNGLASDSDENELDDMILEREDILYSFHGIKQGIFMEKQYLDVLAYYMEYKFLQKQTDVKEISKYTFLGEWLNYTLKKDKKLKKKNAFKISNLCPHGNKKQSDCKKCGGNGICEHGNHKRFCPDCGGKGLCEHNRPRYLCPDCKGEGICKHNRRKYYCPDCKGKGLCEHNRNKYYCPDCKGKGLCEHNRRKSRCPDCGGKGLCEHNRQKNDCSICYPMSCTFCKRNVSKSYIKNHEKRCTSKNTLDVDKVST